MEFHINILSTFKKSCKFYSSTLKRKEFHMQLHYESRLLSGIEETVAN
jgi:hypothetical protein